MHSTAEFERETTGQKTRVSWAQAQREDSFWQRAFRQERYYSARFDYEDYAPAYCVGYAGWAQYGGDFGDAEPSLCANWERIKGDSRLCLEQAMPAIRAAWNRMALEQVRRLQLTVPQDEVATRPRRRGLPMHLNTIVPPASGGVAAVS